MPSSAPRVSRPLFQRLELLAAWKRLSVGLLPAGLLYAGAPAAWPPMMRLFLAWDGFALCTVLLTWGIMVSADVAHIRRVATREDPGRVASFGIVLVACSASLLAVVGLLAPVRQGPGPLQLAQAAVGTVGVLTAWLLVHTLFTLRYAHLFYDNDGRPEGGLAFPGNGPDPDYLDFAYFSFVVGMTAQTADVSITDRSIRRLALLHGVLSFGLNTAVVALTINGLAGVV
ncbi:DUF1345 domain-containing protein [Hymenobacter yonginensis]|uniref:DUF1345 domain-containing protein n=1 Tax=Hymenobacter yonginensis TaxID=748197 RepID=A0ABY7PLY7_9BACT|nr:DUF1345 domain-containing protein [Hymenobacter yonginensis]WBO83716.1 DUF1345 domain-containing protein [Hymenobacter yonginensis]